MRVTDPAGKWKKFTMDALGHLVQVNEPDAVSGGATAVSIYNTGVTGSGLAPDGTTDSHYTLVSSADPAYPGPAVKVITSNAWPIPPWPVDGPNSKWVGPRTDTGTPSYNSQGNYTYRTTFDLTGRDSTTAVVSGSVAADDSVTIQLNGNRTVRSGRRRRRTARRSLPRTRSSGPTQATKNRRRSPSPSLTATENVPIVTGAASAIYKWEQDCPPGKKRATGQLPLDPPDQNRPFQHWDNLDCDGNSWSVVGRVT